jgi:hypothetical protein
MARALGHIHSGHLTIALYESATHIVLIPSCDKHGISHEPVVVRKFDPQSAPLIQPCPVCVASKHAATLGAVA